MMWESEAERRALLDQVTAEQAGITHLAVKPRNPDPLPRKFGRMLETIEGKFVAKRKSRHPHGFARPRQAGIFVNPKKLAKKVKSIKLKQTQLGYAIQRYLDAPTPVVTPQPTKRTKKTILGPAAPRKTKASTELDDLDLKALEWLSRAGFPR